jgi:hypothetical protein
MYQKHVPEIIVYAACAMILLSIVIDDLLNIF